MISSDVALRRAYRPGGREESRQLELSRMAALIEFTPPSP
jgi:hypothetical protein